jgi:hypothetical protein
MDDEGPTARERHQLGSEKSSAEDSDVEVSFYILLSSVRLNKSSSWVATVGSEIIPTICHTRENKKLSRLHLTFFDTQVNSQSAIFYKERGNRTRVLMPNCQTTETIRMNLKVARLRGTACLTTPGEKQQCSSWIQGLGSRGASFVEFRTIPS